MGVIRASVALKPLSHLSQTHKKNKNWSDGWLLLKQRNVTAAVSEPDRRAIRTPYQSPRRGDGMSHTPSGTRDTSVNIATALAKCASIDLVTRHTSSISTRRIVRIAFTTTHIHHNSMKTTLTMANGSPMTTWITVRTRCAQLISILIPID